MHLTESLATAEEDVGLHGDPQCLAVVIVGSVSLPSLNHHVMMVTNSLQHCYSEVTPSASHVGYQDC